jgi:hypothetical protein
MRNAEANDCHMPDPLHGGVLEAITYHTFLSVVSLGRLAQDCPLHLHNARLLMVPQTLFQEPNGVNSKPGGY